MKKITKEEIKPNQVIYGISIDKNFIDFMASTNTMKDDIEYLYLKEPLPCDSPYDPDKVIYGWRKYESNYKENKYRFLKNLAKTHKLYLIDKKDIDKIIFMDSL